MSIIFVTRARQLLISRLKIVLLVYGCSFQLSKRQMAAAYAAFHRNDHQLFLLCVPFLIFLKNLLMLTEVD